MDYENAILLSLCEWAGRHAVFDMMCAGFNYAIVRSPKPVLMMFIASASASFSSCPSQSISIEVPCCIPALRMSSIDLQLQCLPFAMTLMSLS